MVFSFKNWLRQLFPQAHFFATQIRPRRRGQACLRLEQLEYRWVPSVATVATFYPFPNGFTPRAGLVEDSHGNLFGTTETDGPSGDGTVFEVAAGSTTITTLAAFNGANGAGPVASLILDGSGNLFGTTGGGGTYNNGTVFELLYNNGTGNYGSSVTTLANFTVAAGGPAYPFGSLVRDSHGNLLGTTDQGGADGYGTVFELAYNSGTGLYSSTITTLDYFTFTNGSNPYSGLAVDSSGNLFGTTEGGGASSDGTVFEVTYNSSTGYSSTITTLASFSGANGSSPLYETPVVDGSDNVFGTTDGGGTSSDGTVFEVKHGSGAITTLANFNGTNGQNPWGGVIEDAQRNLFGTTISGGANGQGTVFELTYNSGTGNYSSTINTLVSFNGANGGGPTAGVIEDANHNLFGTSNNYFGTTQTGLFDSVFEVAYNSGTGLYSNTINTVATFNSAQGGNPATGVIEDHSGNLLGTASVGGAFGGGMVFEVAAGSGVVTPLASFSNAYGKLQASYLIQDNSGDLVGTTGAGGAYGDGTVYDVPYNSTTGLYGTSINILASFNGSTSGIGPFTSGVIKDSHGDYFGTTSGGGSAGQGTVFELPAGSGIIKTLASFTSFCYPIGSLVEDSSGDLFGTTEYGGTSSKGTLFEVAYNSGTGLYSSTITTLINFNGTNGEYPQGGLIADSKGDLFGTAGGGGGTPSDGTVFELAYNMGSGYSSTLTTLANFNGTNGTSPAGGLVEDSSGNLYGTTSSTVFEVAAGSGTITTLASISGGPGLIEDGTGNFYGVTAGGGTFGRGTVFEVQRVPTSVEASNQTTTFNTSSQSVTLSATVTPSSGTVNEGTVTFGVFSGSTQIGASVTSSTVASNTASVTFTLPAGTPIGSYAIHVSYSGGPDDVNSNNSGDTTFPTLTVNPYATSVEASAQSATFNVANQSVTLNATVNSTTGGAPNVGTVTFSVYNGLTQIGSSATSSTVSGGAASATYTLPGGTAVGTYSIHVSYSGGGNYGSSNNSGDTTFPALTVNPAATSVEASAQSASFSVASESVTLNATVSGGTGGTPNVGTVTFSVFSGATQIGSSATSSTVSGGAASASYTLPGGTALGTYSIHVSYNGGGNFAGSNNSGDVTFPLLTVNPAPTTVEASTKTVIFSTSSQSVTLSATVSSGTGGNPNIGTVTFSVFNGATQIGSSVTSSTVSSGSASASYTLPAGTPPLAYSIHVSYTGGGNFAASDNSGDVTFPTLIVLQDGALVYNGQPGYSQTAGFINYSDPNAYAGVEAYAAPGTGANTATWSVPFLAPGTYYVGTTWTAYMNRATNATYKVYDGATLLGAVTVDQTQHPTGGVTYGGVAFQNLGRFTINSGTLTVVLSDNANGYVIANAVGVVLATLPTLVDNSQYGYSDSGGGWMSYGDPNAYFGNERYVAPGSGANMATWQVTGLSSSVYDVQVDWTAYSNRADNATYKVYDGATLLAAVHVDQQLAPATGATVGGVTFQSLGRFTIGSGTLNVVLSDNADGYVIADAMLVELATLPAVVDNSQGGYSDAGGSWASFMDANAYFGNERYVSPGTGTNTATWQAPGLAPGIYDVQVDWTAFANRATNATYQIYDGTTLLGTATIDQTKSPTGGATINGITFQSLGRFTINSGTVKVVLSDNSNGYVIADAMLAEVATLPAVIDNSQGGYSDAGGGWASFNDPNAYLGNERYVAPGTGSNAATWQTSGLASGPYNVYVDWTPYAGRATNATYQIFDGTTLLATTSIDQTHAPSGDVVLNGVPFQSLGRFPITSGTVKVVLSDNANGYVIADAMYVKVATGQVVVDNGQYGYAETGTGWTSFNDPNAFNGNERYVAPGTGANTATWSVPDLAAGTYNVQVDWTAYANRATNATYQIFDGATLLGTVTVNQQLTPTGGSTVNGVTFQSLGQFTISSGTLRVVLTDNANGYVIADAMLAM
jgi:uncharacterized repeat protein (TIGR03803 family)